eukprot:2069327-Heterocapsa_arctica.AAC.1
MAGNGLQSRPDLPAGRQSALRIDCADAVGRKAIGSGACDRSSCPPARPARPLAPERWAGGRPGGWAAGRPIGRLA